MAKLKTGLSRLVTLVVVAAVVAGGVYYAFFRGASQKTVTAQFASAVGVYPGTPVKILGVNVGTVSSVKPKGSYVAVKMSYDGEYRLPKNAEAVLVANSLVSDRYVQLPLAAKGAATMADNATIPMAHTESPAELDDIYNALNTLSVALGPQGANKGGQKNGALSTLVNVAAANLKGNGAALGNSITKLSQAAETLSSGRKDLFGTVQNLQKFTAALTASDYQVRKFNNQLAQVAGDLADERTDLGSALKLLGNALDDVNNFVKSNAGKIHTSVQGLESITTTLVNEKSSLNETLAIAPVALANITHAYQPNLGVIATRSNLISLSDVDGKTVCAILYSTIHSATAGTNVLGSLTGTINTVCTSLLTKIAGDPLKAVSEILGGLTTGEQSSIAQGITDLLNGVSGLPGGLIGALGGN